MEEVGLIQGLEKPNIARKMFISDICLFAILTLILFGIPGLLVWGAIADINEPMDYFILIPFGVILLLWSLLEGMFIFLLVNSIKARKEVVQVAINQNYSILEDFLSLKDFKGQYKMKQKELFKMKYAIGILGDQKREIALPYLEKIMFYPKSLSWGIRRWAAIATAKIGTIQAIHILTHAQEKYKKPKESMIPRPITSELGSILISYSHTLRAYRTVKRLLKKLMEINGYSDENQMMEAVLQGS